MMSLLRGSEQYFEQSPDSFICFVFLCRKCSNPVNYLRQQLLMTLQEVLLDDGRPFCSHYGAVVGLTELGPEVQIKNRF